MIKKHFVLLLRCKIRHISIGEFLSQPKTVFQRCGRLSCARRQKWVTLGICGATVLSTLLLVLLLAFLTTRDSGSDGSSNRQLPPRMQELRIAPRNGRVQEVNFRPSMGSTTEETLSSDPGKDIFVPSQ